MQNHFVYILYSKSRKIFYVGITMNVENRIKEHNSGQSNFTSSGTPWKLLWCTVKQDESAALILETKIKNLSVRKKLDFMSKNSEDIVNRELYYKLH